MEWATLIKMLMEFFGPLIRKWIEGLFNKGAPDGSPLSLDAPAGMARLFAAARAQTWWWQGSRRALLAACERVATRRAFEFWLALRTGTLGPKMTAAEELQIAAAL